MKCSTVHGLISAYLDRELQVAKQALLATHLDECGSCRAELAALRQIGESLAGAERFAAPVGFARRVTVSLAQAPAEPFSSRLFLLRFAEAAVLLLVIGLGMALGSLSGSGAEAKAPGKAVAALHLDIFDAAPPQSMGGVYLAMTEVPSEK